jgi:hypothetical protein
MLLLGPSRYEIPRCSRLSAELPQPYRDNGITHHRRIHDAKISAQDSGNGLPILGGEDNSSFEWRLLSVNICKYPTPRNIKNAVPFDLRIHDCWVDSGWLQVWVLRWHIVGRKAVDHRKPQCDTEGRRLVHFVTV